MTKANKLRETENLQEHLQRIIHLLHEHKLAEEPLHAAARADRSSMKNGWISRIWRNCKVFSTSSILPTSRIFWKLCRLKTAL